MKISLFLVFAGALLTCLIEGHSIRNPSVLRRATSKHVLFKDLQVSKRQILERTAKLHDKRSPEPTRTIPTSGDSSRRYRRQAQDDGYKTKVYRYLNDCHDGIQSRVDTITSLCSSITQENAQQMAWKIVAELQAILALLVACYKSIQGSPNEPTPSATPGGKVPCAEEISQVMFQILGLLKTCFEKVQTTSSQYSVVQSACSDVLSQVASSLSNCISISGTMVPGVVKLVSDLAGGVNLSQFFGSVGSGLNQVISVLHSI